MSEYSEEANRYIYGSPVQTSRAQYCHTLPQKSEEKAIAALEAGIVVTVHCAKRKPMNLTLCLRSQQTDLICVSSFGGKPLYTVDLYQVKEVITDPQARLARYSEEIINDHSELCISLFYGSNFMLNVITFVARSKEDFGHLHLALQASYDKLKKNSFYERKQRWLNREFQKIQMLHQGFFHSQKEGKINLKQIQSWLMQHTNTITRHYLALTKAKLHLPDNLELNHFANLLNELFKPNPVTDRLLKDYGQSSPNCQWKLTKDCFEIFLEKEQKEEINENVSQIMKLCLPLSACSPQGVLCFSDREFEDYLYSEMNSILDPRELSIHQSMDFPLSCYWISSSHNTYLTGDQWLSEAHVETYVRCLQMGCRCLELDCWDGTDGRPIITHGKTFVSKIKLSDVLQTIKEHAWEASEYPLILSFENHCSLPQQRIMASLLKEIFKDDLLTEQIDINETQLPSPNKLMRKIIVKNKKLGGSTDTRNYVDMSDLADEKKHSILLMKYATDKKWNEYAVVLGDTHICFTPHIQHMEDDQIGEEDEEYYIDDSESDDDEDAEDFSAIMWYHGKIKRDTAKDLLMEHRMHGDGTFLVRESDAGGLAISFIVQGRVTHSKIQCHEKSDGQKRYLVGNEIWHSSLKDMVQYYMTHKLTYKEKQISLKLTFPVKKVLGFEHENWFYRYIDRAGAEDFLKRIPIDGVYLIRPSSVENCFSLTLRYHRRISHYQIEYRRNKFVLAGKYRFTSMQKLIEYFSQHPLYKTARLSTAASSELVVETDDDYFYHVPVDYSECSTAAEKQATVKALYDYHASNSDELSFKRGALITNVVIADEPWWRGDHGASINKLFPANYVEVLDNCKSVENVNLEGPSEAMLRLSDCHFDEATYSRDEMHYFTLINPNLVCNVYIGSKIKAEAEEWHRLVCESKAKIGEEFDKNRREERSRNIAKELSDIVIYCQAVPYNPSRPGKFYEMSSFSEERVSNKDDRELIRYNQYQISRVYPKFLRWNSTNFDPLPKWNYGCQMVALNYQTPDKSMQLNQAMFLQNGRCGYVLKPSFMNNSNYNPSDLLTLRNYVNSVVLTVTVLGARNLSVMNSGVGIMHPYVVVEVLGLPLDSQRERTRMLSDKNSLYPIWKNENFIFQVSCPELAFIRFEIGTELNETTCLAQATFHMKSIRPGFRSVQLLNNFSESLPYSSLLVHIEMKNPKEEEEKNVFRIVEETRKLYEELSASNGDERKREQLQQTEQKLLEYLNRSRNSGAQRVWRK